jgi:hypothetical protein
VSGTCWIFHNIIFRRDSFNAITFAVCNQICFVTKELEVTFLGKFFIFFCQSRANKEAKIIFLDCPYYSTIKYNNKTSDRTVHPVRGNLKLAAINNKTRNISVITTKFRGHNVI